MLKSLPTMLWVIGATVAVAALSPAVGNVATTAPPVVAQPPPPATSAPSAPPPSKAVKPAVPVEEPVVIKAGTTKLGLVAVDAEGFTLYLSVLDSKNPSKSVCVSKACLAAWKPVYVKKAGIVAGAGVSQAKVGTLVRPDKDIQATLGGWPLYRFAKDKKPGDVLGEGLKGTWHVLSPAGTRLNR
ncbi:hypothetical protein [Streptomyces sp. SID13031]|uniref:COG4315 family predicted lipoprotein n=1 Tax=Streptomyces sp. SID13031 TaxID=2706046 RepID=UPI0013CB85BE|nr:hypothetical protein [Streptomyces sp. SID13031]NEA34925.1 hypothetical protein [Streptomyces sp. SID13031]